MNNLDTPLYESAPTRKSMGNKYSIYADRIELKCRFPFVTKTFEIKKDDLVSIDTYKPPVLRTTFWALKLDWADLTEHVGVKRKKGFFQRFYLSIGNGFSKAVARR